MPKEFRHITNGVGHWGKDSISGGTPIKTSRVILCFSCLLILAALLGCSSSTPTPDAQATINAAVQATSIAQANVQATIDAAVKATAAAQPTPPLTEPVSGATTAATAKAPAATPAPTVNATTMTEEELDALIDQAVKEAVAATNTATTQTATYAADGTLTPQEVAAMQAAVTASQTEINQALALTQSYYDLYADLSTETLNTLKAIKQDLNSMAQSLAQINTTLAQGLTLTQSTLTQLQSYATKASQAASAQTKEKNWNATVQSELTKRATTALDTKPMNVPTDLRGATQGEAPKAKASLGALEQSARSLPSLPSVPSVPQLPRK